MMRLSSQEMALIFSIAGCRTSTKSMMPRLESIPIPALYRPLTLSQYLFQVQLCENLEDQQVEYAGKVWDPEKYPWQTVARLHIPKQDSFNYALKNFWEDRLRVDPWMGLKTLQPLGSPNRLRKLVYPASSALRRKINATTEFHIKSLDELPVH
jgi:hypothetical protein